MLCYRNRFPANEHHQDFGYKLDQKPKTLKNQKYYTCHYAETCIELELSMRYWVCWWTAQLLQWNVAAVTICNAFVCDSTCRWTPELRLNGMCVNRLNNHKWVKIYLQGWWMQYTSSLSLFVAVQMSTATIVNKVSSVFSNREHSPTQFNEVLRSNLIDGIREFVTRREGF